MVETGRVIHGRYLLQRLVKQGQHSTVYQGSDQVLNRSVVVKVTPAEHISAYRAAIRATSQFSHPNIIGIYDLIVEPTKLYIVQEYVEGDDFSALLQTPLTPSQVVDLGAQVCQALIYAASGSRRVCHGDLTTAAIIRDRRGLVRVNNFALPSDMYYFTNWSVVGGDGRAVSDSELPWGKLSDVRREDDTRATGLLLYQLLMSRSAGATGVEPSTDGRMRFMRNVPPELCELVARAVIRQHPQHLTTAEDLHKELKSLAETLEPPATATVAASPPEEASPAQVYAGSGRPVSVGGRETPQVVSYSPSAYAPDPVAIPTASAITDVPSMPDISLKLAASRQAAYQAEQPQEAAPRINVPVVLLLGLVLFALFFVIGYFIATAVIH